ncbi:MAG: cupin domain-containing protein [Candidatus Thorarchaeota archaeon]|nr:cupin domain-containing protein [Candidatus Thorarchaeota archaeon]
MPQVYRSDSAQSVDANGYVRRYVASVSLQRGVTSAGFILVTISPGVRTSRHRHDHLTETFVAMTRILARVDDDLYDLAKGDILVVAPGEAHSFETPAGSSGELIAIKMPDLHHDKVDIPDTET